MSKSDDTVGASTNAGSAASGTDGPEVMQSEEDGSTADPLKEKSLSSSSVLNPPQRPPRKKVSIDMSGQMESFVADMDAIADSKSRRKAWERRKSTVADLKELP